MIQEHEHKYLQRCIELAAEALNNGDRPFGSVLVDASGKILYEDRNRAVSIDATRHPEFEIARWAAANMSPEQRSQATVYTSGEHCAMCSAAHGWAGLGRIVYISSSKQLVGWLKDMGITYKSPINSLSIQEVLPNIQVEGPIAGFDEQVHALHKKLHAN